MFFEQDFFGFVFRQVGDLSDNQQFFNQGESFFLAFIHDVLLGSSSQDSLQEKDSHFPLDSIFFSRGLFVKFWFGDSLLPVNNIHVFVMSVIGSGWTSNNVSQCLDVIADSLVLLLLWFIFSFNVVLGHLERLFV